jgi:uncharacterized protein YuzE
LGAGGGVKLTYDPRHNVAYIRLHEKVGQVKTIKIGEETTGDLASDGTMHGTNS